MIKQGIYEKCVKSWPSVMTSRWIWHDVEMLNMSSINCHNILTVVRLSIVVLDVPHEIQFEQHIITLFLDRFFYDWLGFLSSRRLLISLKANVNKTSRTIQKIFKLVNLKKQMTRCKKYKNRTIPKRNTNISSWLWWVLANQLVFLAFYMNLYWIQNTNEYVKIYFLGLFFPDLQHIYLSS